MKQAAWYALGVWQPWASLLVKGLKDVENREWHNAPGLQSQMRSLIGRGDRLIIHASKTVQRTALGVARRAGLETDNLPLGALIGTVTPHSLSDWSPSPWYAPGQMAISVRGAVEFTTPIPFVGRQGLIPVKDEVLEQVAAQLRWKGVTL